MGSRSQSFASKYGEKSRGGRSRRKPVQPRRPALPLASAGNDMPPERDALPAVVPLQPIVSHRSRRQQLATDALATDYGYVVKDLRQIALTAIAMFAIIAVLAFVVR